MPVTVARTGYTGEDGFEIFTPPDHAADVWKAITAAGAGQGLLPAGLGARDTLRLEAKMCLYGNDMDETTTLVEAGLGWIVSLGGREGRLPRALRARRTEAGGSGAQARGLRDDRARHRAARLSAPSPAPRRWAR